MLDGGGDILPAYNTLYKTYSRGAAYLNDLYMSVSILTASDHSLIGVDFY